MRGKLGRAEKQPWVLGPAKAASLLGGIAFLSTFLAWKNASSLDNPPPPEVGRSHPGVERCRLSHLWGQCLNS